MTELQIFEFDPGVGIYGFTREALETLSNVLGDLPANQPTIVFVQQHPMTERAWLSKGNRHRWMAAGCDPTHPTAWVQAATDLDGCAAAP